ncbi:MAG: hypothetical protein DMD54_04715, partial [Gemmatimonadetes bacterium]
MPFKHKLSRRLALMRNLLVGMALLTACQEIAALLQQVVTITISPASGSVVVGQTLQLTATPLDGTGQPLSGKVVTWQTSDASIATVDGSGLVGGAAA